METTTEIRRFLVVDENPENTTYFKVLLMEHQIPNVTVSNSAHEALELVESKRIQFIIVAREMSEMAGSIFVQKVHAIRQFKHVPCLIYSKEMGEADIRLAKELGINVFGQPFHKQEIWDTLEPMIRKEERLAPEEIKLREIESLVAEKQYKPAIAAAKPLLGPGRVTAQAHTLMGEAYFHLKELKDSERALDNALEEKQSYTPALQLIAKVYSQTDRHEKAIDMLCQMVEASPMNLRNLLNLGGAYEQADDLENAKKTYDRVKDLDPTNKEANEGLGKVAFKEGNFEAGTKFLAEMENAEELGRFFNNLAIGLVNKGEFIQGINTYDAAIKIMTNKDKTKLPLLHYNLGLAMRKKGELKKAFEILSDLYLNHPDYQKAYESLIRLIRELDRKKVDYDRSIMTRIQQLRKAS